MIIAVLLDALSNLVPLFDKSPLLVTPNSSPLVRWDAIHFLAIANNGYQFEQQWAFLPGIALLVRAFNALLGLEFGVKGVSLLISLLTLDSFRVLYELSLIHLNSEKLAHIATVLALFPSSPATLFAVPYNEPFFTYFSYRGMLFCARKQWLLAALSFAAATTFRSNGIFLAGYIIWGLLVLPYLSNPSINLKLLLSTIYTALLTALVFVPFIGHNYHGYHTFCIPPPASSTAVTFTPPDWCNKPIPSIYTHVQAEYWNNGLFKYWTIQQLPNFIIGAPPLILLFTFGVWHLRQVLPTLFSKPAPSTAPRSNRKPMDASKAEPDIVKKKDESTSNPFTSLSLTPHVIHALFTSSILLFASHTQIILRLAAAMPTLYWAAAWLWYVPPGTTATKTRYAKWWIYWSAIWGLISIVLWVAFLPPA
ncbi:GPI mannosyltransferase 2 [Coprinopsis cinerea okayama7|uniref:GPI mannosyltransferase 2 n=1 Tax=Coprinopsis cinerea (strain Okayama-7 / 130 / ATCC MYA-4618 / FGSC 9003) TaxID=240176 RepID=A8N6M5_COPC7|nr:GPI mannosyltransferase 2 [Coprinopsis cinerea okayama7\|eukprot:XP_001830481.1 GPI mannosyltransferase 2 [Coprinopsis cinerea okayama7\